MDFEPGDIVVITKHFLSYVVGRNAEVQSVHPGAARAHPLLPLLASPTETWYVVIDVTGESHIAAHSWLRRADPVLLDRITDDATYACDGTVLTEIT